MLASVDLIALLLTALQIFGFIAVGNLLSPPIGGIVYDKAGNKGVFIIAFAFLLVDFILRALMIEPQISDRYEGHTQIQTRQSTVSTPQGADIVEEGIPNARETTRLLPRSERSTTGLDYRISPNLPTICQNITILPCLSDPRLLSALFLSLVQATLLGSFDATIPTMAKEYYNLSSLHAGLLFLPLGITDFVLGPVFGIFVDRFGTKLAAVCSYACLSMFLCLLRLPQPGASGHVWLYGGILGLCGIGMAGTNSPAIVEASTIMENYYEANQAFFGHRQPYAQLYGLNNMVFSAGLALGPEVAGELKQRIGYGNMNAVLAAVCAFAVLLSLKYIGVSRSHTGLH